MKRLSISVLAAIVITSLGSCVKSDNYNTQPVQTGYQHSFSDDFSYDNHNWSFTDGPNHAQAFVQDGLLHYNYHPAGSGVNANTINTGWDRSRNSWDIQTRFSSDNAMGLVFGVSGSDYGYSVFIDTRGYFAVYDEGTTSLSAQPILDWQLSNAVRNGSNDVEVEQYNGKWTGYINGTQVFQIPAHTLYGDKIGFELLANTNGFADYLDVQY